MNDPRWATSPDDRARCLDLRRAVFVDEQGVAPHEEVDGLDDACRHALVEDAGGAIGTLRVRPIAGAAKIERMADAADRRGAGIGAALMRWVLAELEAEGRPEVVLAAQTQALGFYRRLGFVAVGSQFQDAGIPHRTMRRSSGRRAADAP